MMGRRRAPLWTIGLKELSFNAMMSRGFHRGNKDSNGIFF
jgi:hypothetical protein